MKQTDSYIFGNSLRDAIVSGKIKKTQIGKKFEEKLFLKTGIRVWHSYFDSKPHQPFLLLEVDIQNSSAFLLNSNCRIIHGNYYPEKQLFETILECVNDAAEECGLSKINFSSIPSIVICDYRATARNIYFNVNIVKIDTETRNAFPNVKFMLRWRHAQSEYYYLIFENDEERDKANREQITEKIIDFVNTFCKRNDPLYIFDEERMLPAITSKQEIQNRGEWMGIIRNNTEFKTW